MTVKSLVLLCVVVTLGLSLTQCCSRQAMKREVGPAAIEQRVKVEPLRLSQKEEGVVRNTAPAPAPLPAVAATALNDIHFDYDRFNIRPGDAKVLEKNYDWFAAHPSGVRIEGYCDERGTVEYNLVLGQKRADSAKSYMIKLGVDEKRLETISYGKENPVDTGHNETAWSRNRRVHFTPLH